MATTFKIKQGDLLPILRGRIYDRETNLGQDLTGAVLTFHMKAEGGEVLIDAPAEIDGDQLVEAEKGMWRYEWQLGDTGPYDEAEMVQFFGEVQCVFGDKPLTGPNDKLGFSILMAPQIA